MPDYNAPLEDIYFVLYDVLDADNHYQTLNANEASRDMVEAILSEGAKFCEEVLSPLNQIGDQQGCTLSDGQVTTPEGFKAAYQHWVDGGWPCLSASEDHGGQGLPESIGNVLNEMAGTANWAWSMYPGLSHGAINTLEQHGSDEQKKQWLEPLISGEYTGTMCLTEPQCGTDLGLLKTKAVACDDGSYNIDGTKIFISAGDHDLTENIIHIVLARVPDAPEGTRGISLFVVPKLLSDGSRNGVSCGALEHKMGIHGNATCVMNFDNAQGWLIGEENKGLNCMFTFMNFARIGTAIQGLGAAELSYQGALAYAKERLAMRALSGAKNPEKNADPIIVHPDVRRMLLTQKAFAEGGRALIYLTSFYVDTVRMSTDEKARKEADDLLGFLTPITKAFLTEVGFESANHGVQVFGGHGYIKEWGMEQIVRDARISMLYEGTTGIQALDLLGRKVLQTQGDSLKKFTKIIHQFCAPKLASGALAEFVEPLNKLNQGWGMLTMHLGMKAMQDKEEVGAASVDYIMFSGYVTLAYLWAKMADVALEQLKAGEGNKAFLENKIKTARFYYQRILPRTQMHKLAMMSGADNLMDYEF
jgi:alkylation response protein AidB-like acyl-CoA dehydrogenase